jgi:tRNA threonylcarbamoyladenosine biosynthesis protein TsaE
MTQTFTTHSAEETREVGKDFAHTLKPGTLVCFEGNLGAGKTTFIQGLLEGLGAEKPFVSPTFILMKQYDLLKPKKLDFQLEVGLPVAQGLPIVRIYHADAYRLGTPEFREIGFEEWIADTEAVTLLEWPERIAELLPKKYITVKIESLSEAERRIEIGERGES